MVNHILGLGHLLVQELLSVLWHFDGSACQTLSGIAATVVGPMQMQKKSAFSPG